MKSYMNEISNYVAGNAAHKDVIIDFGTQYIKGPDGKHVPGKTEGTIMAKPVVNHIEVIAKVKGSYVKIYFSARDIYMLNDACMAIQRGEETEEYFED